MQYKHRNTHTEIKKIVIYTIFFYFPGQNTLNWFDKLQMGYDPQYEKHCSKRTAEQLFDNYWSEEQKMTALDAWNS